MVRGQRRPGAGRSRKMARQESQGSIPRWGSQGSSRGPDADSGWLSTERERGTESESSPPSWTSQMGRCVYFWNRDVKATSWCSRLCEIFALRTPARIQLHHLNLVLPSHRGEHVHLSVPLYSTGCPGLATASRRPCGHRAPSQDGLWPPSQGHLPLPVMEASSWGPALEVCAGATASSEIRKLSVHLLGTSLKFFDANTWLWCFELLQLRFHSFLLLSPWFKCSSYYSPNLSLDLHTLSCLFLGCCSNSAEWDGLD